MTGKDDTRWLGSASPKRPRGREGRPGQAAARADHELRERGSWGGGKMGPRPVPEERPPQGWAPRLGWVAGLSEKSVHQEVACTRGERGAAGGRELPAAPESAEARCGLRGSGGRERGGLAGPSHPCPAPGLTMVLGWLHAPIDVMAAGVPPAVVQALPARPSCASAWQDGRLSLGEGWHLLQHRGLQGFGQG